MIISRIKFTWNTVCLLTLNRNKCKKSQIKTNWFQPLDTMIFNTVNTLTAWNQTNDFSFVWKIDFFRSWMLFFCLFVLPLVACHLRRWPLLHSVFLDQTICNFDCIVHTRFSEKFDQLEWFSECFLVSTNKKKKTMNNVVWSAFVRLSFVNV